MILNLVKIFLPTTLTFLIGILITPTLSHFFYKYSLWKKKARTSGEEMSADFTKIHNTESELHTPRVGGVIIWIAILLCAGIMFLLSRFVPGDIAQKLDFLSRGQTLIPLGALILGAVIGLIDDLLQVTGHGSYAADNINYRKVKIIAVTVIAVLISLWFFVKLDISSIHIPFAGSWELGVFFIPVFVLVMLAVFSSSVIDGLDGLSGGVLATVFAAYAGIAFGQNHIDLAALCAVITGGILAFLWFNIPPARFYMGETGMLGLTVVLAVVAFLTDTVLLLPIIAFPLFVTSLSVILQINSKKYFKRKIFRVAPLHHHFKALGWSSERVVMRYWVVSIIASLLGMVIALIS